MKLTELVLKSKLEQISLLHDATKGWDKYLVMELLNCYFDEIHDILISKYSTYEQVKDDTTVYLREYYFHKYEFLCGELFIHKDLIFFDMPITEVLGYWNLYDIIEILENTLTDSLSDEDLQKLHPDKGNALKTSKKSVFDYCQVGVLFAQGFIKKKGFDYFYKEQSFKSSLVLAKYLKENDIVAVDSVRQLIDNTFSDNKQSLYNSTKSKNILEYCSTSGITPVQEFLNAVSEFESL
ncbi:MAG: hypothetical protein ACI83H_001565 [Glaciecola sp.]|jgi:hypothetical protein